MKKGFIALIPLFAAAVLISIASIGGVASQRNKPLDAGSILSSSNSSGSDEDNDEDEDKSGKSESRSQKSETKTKFEQKSENAKSKSETKIEQENDKLKIKTKNKVEGGIEEEFEFEVEDDDEELEIEDEDEDDDENDDDEGTPSATSSARQGRKIRSNFPITVNPLTGEKTVTTPSGIKIVILPDVAIQNMINAGFPVVLPPAPPPSPPEGTQSATQSAPLPTGTDEGAVTLTEFEGQLAYEIPAVKPQKFLGVLKVDVKVKGIVSAQSGSILKVQKSLFDSILDLLSF